MYMPIMAEVTLFTHIVGLNGSTIHVFTNPIMLEANKSSLSDTIPTRNGRELGEIWVSKVGVNF